MGYTRKPASKRGLLVATYALTAAAAVAAVTTLRYELRVPHDAYLAAALVGALIILFAARPSRGVSGRDNIEVMSLDEVAIVPALILLAPWQYVVLNAIAQYTSGLVLRRSALKTAFNIANGVLSASMGVALVQLCNVHPSTSPDMNDVFVAMLGAFVVTAVSAVNVTAMVCFATGSSYREELAQLGARILPWSGAIALGGLGALAFGLSRWSAIVTAAAVVFVQRAYAASIRENTAKIHAQRVQQAIVSLRGLTDPSKVQADLLESTKELLGARFAEIVPEGKPGPSTSHGAPFFKGMILRVDNRIGRGGWDETDRDTLLTLAGVAGDVLRSADLIARLRTITNSQSEGVIALDLQTRITFANPAAVRMLGRNSDEELLGHRIRDTLILRHRRVPVDFISMVQEQQVAHDADATLGPPDGETLDIAYSVTPLRAEGAHVGAVIVLRDVTERRAFQDELTRRALHDELTGLPNRRLLLERLDHALARSSTTGVHHGLLFLDLDRFKLVNDSYGHIVGDKLLIQVAARLSSGVSAADSVARMSGDEFIVLVEDAPDMECVTAVAERLLQVMQEPFDVDGHHIFMSASIGVGLTVEGQGRDVILASIDAAAYAAKASGRNCYRVSTDASVDETRARLDLEVSLRQGLDENELELHYQPIVTAATGEVVGAEALVRWRSPQRGILWPQQFVPVAEETGLIVPMGRWVLEDACRTLRRWSVEHPDRRPLSVSVNLSALQFAQHRLAEDVADTLEMTGLPPSQLCLEITETVLMSDTLGTIATLSSLHDLGVRVAIDDFGTGYSSLSYLKRFAIDVVKLDRTFIEGLVTDAVDAEIASAVIKLAEALGMSTVAEGVETDDQREMLVKLGCPLIQGYLTSRPIPAPDFENFWLTSGQAYPAWVAG